jgi:hypothetical protein
MAQDSNVFVDLKSGDGRTVAFFAETTDDNNSKIPWCVKSVDVENAGAGCENTKVELDPPQSLGLQVSVLRLRVKALTFLSCESRANEVATVLKEAKVRSVVAVAAASCAPLTICLALCYPKLVRQLILIDPLLRPHPSWLERLASSIERNLPFGLPLRTQHSGFDGEPFIHRLRLPVLVITTKQAGSQGDKIIKKAPISWKICLTAPLDMNDLWKFLSHFQGVAVKFPMRRSDLVKGDWYQHQHQYQYQYQPDERTKSGLNF